MRTIEAVFVMLTVVTAPAVAQTAAAPTAQDTRRYEGRRVEEVLRQLQADGARIVFANTLVTPDLRVVSEPRARERRALVEEILAAHGLGLRNGPGQTWLVVRVTPRPPRSQAADPAATREGQSPVPAETPPATPLRIEERVTVSERSGDLAGQPSVYAIAPKAAIETAGVLENILYVLPTLPGVAAVNDEEGKMAIRGGGPEHNTMLFDGVQIHTPQRAGDFGGTFVNPATVSSMALDASGLDARYGGRLSSVTVLETRDGRVDRRLAMSGSAGLTSGDILAEGRLPGTETGSWWATARGTYYKYVADRFQESDIPGFTDLQVKVSSNPSPHLRLAIIGLVGRETMFRPLTAPENDPTIPVEGVRRRSRVDNRLVAANLRWTPGPRVTTTTTATVYSTSARFEDYRFYSRTGPFDRNIQIDDIGVRQRVTALLPRGQTIDAGAEVHHVHGTWAMRGETEGPVHRPIGPDVWGELHEYTGPIDARQDRLHVSAWLQDRVPLGRNMAIEPGLRVDWNSFTGEVAPQPRLRLTANAGDRTTIWAGLSWQAQTPGYETMLQGSPYYDLAGPAAAELTNERSRQIVAGIEHALADTLLLRVEAYRRSFDHLMVQQQETDAERTLRLSRYVLPPDMPPDSAILEYRPTVRPESTGTGRSTGVEVLLQRPVGRLSGWISYTLSRAERELYGRTVPFDYDRRHALGIVLQAQVAGRIRVSVNSQFATGFALTPLHDEVYFTDQIPPFQRGVYRSARTGTGELFVVKDRNHPGRLSLLNSARMPYYARTDLRATFSIGAGIEVYGEILNVMNRDNFHPPFTGGNGVIRGQYEAAPSMPRLPSYGVRISF